MYYCILILHIFFFYLLSNSFTFGSFPKLPVSKSGKLFKSQQNSTSTSTTKLFDTDITFHSLFKREKEIKGICFIQFPMFLENEEFNFCSGIGSVGKKRKGPRVRNLQVLKIQDQESKTSINFIAFLASNVEFIVIQFIFCFFHPMIPLCVIGFFVIIGDPVQNFNQRTIPILLKFSFHYENIMKKKTYIYIYPMKKQQINGICIVY